jgi:hypothetical protein
MSLPVSVKLLRNVQKNVYGAIMFRSKKFPRAKPRLRSSNFASDFNLRAVRGAQAPRSKKNL